VLHSAPMPIAALTTRATTDPTAVYRYRDGLYAADLLTAAIVHFDFFTWLAAHPSTLDAICAEFDFAPRPADVLLTLAATNSLVRCTEGVYALTDTAREHLVAGSPFHLAPYFASLKDRPVVSDFARVLRSGQPAHWGAVEDGQDWHKAMEDETFAQAFTDAMDCRGLYLAQALASRIDLAGRRSLLDVGGGSGIYACVLAAYYPSLRAIVFDQPPVDRIAARLIEARDCQRQVSVRAGSFFTDAWPADCDVHLFSNVLHDWGMAEVEQLIARSAETLRPGGLVVIHEAFINSAKTGPKPVAEYSALLMHSTQGKCYATSEYEPMLTAAGFEDVAYSDTAADRGVMTATKSER
jgi:predicted O-methyltransferase YrrM